MNAKRHGCYGDDFDVNRIIWINPRDIQYVSRQEFPVTTFRGKVLGGDWDLSEIHFDDLDIHQAIRMVCLEGKPWSETVFYQRNLAVLDKGLVIWGCSDQQAFDNRCSNLEYLFRSIQREGYKTQDELAAQHGKKGHREVNQEEIGISIGRSGDLLFSDGAHRTSIAKVLGLQKVPVKVVVRHTQWAEFRKQLIRYSISRGGKWMQPAPHPDLDDIPHNREYPRLFDVIRQDLQISTGSLLDIGAQLGYFCHRFEEQGLECYALEERPEELRFLKKLHHAGSHQFKIIECPIASFEPAPKITFDAILILDYLCQAENQPEKFHDLLTFLRRLVFRRLYVLNLGGSEIDNHGHLATLIKQLDLKIVRPLVQIADERTLYKLS